MILPQFTLRTMLLVMTATSVVGVAGHFAFQRHAPWAVGLVTALLLVGILLAVHGLLFGLFYLFSFTSLGRRSTIRSSLPPAEPPQ